MCQGAPCMAGARGSRDAGGAVTVGPGPLPLPFPTHHPTRNLLIRNRRRPMIDGLGASGIMVVETSSLSRLHYRPTPSDTTKLAPLPL